MENYKVYKHTTPNNKVYIGITGLDVSRRWLGGSGYRNNKYFYRAILKYGWDNIKHEILFSNLNKKQAEQKEIELIAKYNSTNKNYGYNISSGGYATTLGTKLSEETKLKISNANKGNKAWNKGITRTEEEKKKMSINRSGITPWNKGKHWNEETKKHISQGVRNANTGIKIICVETHIIYNSSEEANRETGIDGSAIRKCCKNLKFHKTAGGYHWKNIYT